MANAATILIADDEYSFAHSTCELFCEEGYDCRAAETAQEAVRFLEDHRCNLLISDIRMPGNADLWLLRRARELAPDMPILVATGYPSLATAIQCVELRVAAYLTKPVDFDNLKMRVADLLQRSRPAQHAQPDRTASPFADDLSRCIRDLEAVCRQGRTAHAAPASVLPGVPRAAVRALARCLCELLEREE